jgi:hypothetical protein
MPGQPDIRPAHVIGVDCTELQVLDPNGEESNLIIEKNLAFDVQTKFQLGGTWANFIAGLPIPYTVTYYYDCIGSSDEGTLAATQSLTTVANKLVYDAETKLTVSLPNAGTYKLTVVITFGNAPMTAFFEGPIIQIF